MPNLRIVYDNLADTASTLSASTAAAGMPAGNLLTDAKTRAHRSTGTSVGYTLTWSSVQTVGAAALPACNLTSSATIQVRLFSDTACTVLLADSGAYAACPDWTPKLWNWSQPLNVNAFAYGGAAKTVVWLPTQPATVRGCKIDLVDTSNPAGYIDCARLVVGPYWEPAYNADFGAEFTLVDTTTNERNAAGDLLADAGTVNEMASLSLSWMTPADRTALMALVRNVGTRRNFLLSLFPASPPSALEREHLIYGKRANAGVALPFLEAYSHRLEIQGW